MTYVNLNATVSHRTLDLIDEIAADLGPQLDAAYAAVGLPNMLAPSRMFLTPPLVIVPTAADLIGRIKYLQDATRADRKQLLAEPNETLRCVIRDAIERKSKEVDRLDDCLASLGEKRVEKVSAMRLAAE